MSRPSCSVTHPLPRRPLDCTQGEKTPGLNPRSWRPQLLGKLWREQAQGMSGWAGEPQHGGTAEGLQRDSTCQKAQLNQDAAHVPGGQILLHRPALQAIPQRIKQTLRTPGNLPK